MNELGCVLLKRVEMSDLIGLKGGRDGLCNADGLPCRAACVNAVAIFTVVSLRALNRLREGRSLKESECILLLYACSLGLCELFRYRWLLAPCKLVYAGGVLLGIYVVYQLVFTTAKSAVPLWF